MTRSSAPARVAPRAPDLSPEAAVVDAAFARFEAPSGWRVLRTRARLEAHWSGSDGRWARFSVRLRPTARDRRAQEVMFRRAVGDGELTVTFESSDLGPDTVAAASDLLTPLQHLLARAELPARGI